MACALIDFPEHIPEHITEVCCCGIGVEDVHLSGWDGFDTFIPRAVPLPGGATSTSDSSDGSQGSPSSSCDDDRLRVKEQECPVEEVRLPQVVDQVLGSSVVPCRTRREKVFEMTSTMLRSVRTSVVLRRRAKLLDNAQGTESTYQLSKPVDHLGSFVSHNWCVSRRSKWLALSLHCNFCTALIIAMLIATILCVAASLGYLPLVSVEYGHQTYHALYGHVFGFLGFHVVLLFGPDLLPGWLMRCEEVFLDKVCIHQVDQALQREGIESLGGFLFYSWSMTVLYTSTYTRKLWTVYEMACFLCLHPGGRLEWLPVDLPPVLFLGSLLSWINLTVLVLLTVTSTREVMAIPTWLLPVTLFPAATAITFVTRKVTRDQSSSADDLRHFSIKNAQCAVESDRVVVECNVASLMLDLKFVPVDSTCENALAAFDLLVQNTLPRAINDSTGFLGVRYEQVMTIGAAFIFEMFDGVIGYVVAGSHMQLLVAFIIVRVTFAFAFVPLLFAFMMHLSGFCLHLPGVKSTAFVLLLSTGTVGAFCFFTFAMAFLHTAATEDLFALVILCLISAVLSCLTYFVFRRPRGVQRRRRLGTSSETLEQLGEALASHYQLVQRGRSRLERTEGGNRNGSNFALWIPQGLPF